ncbi:MULTISPECIES: glycosyltransferase family 2 protein [Polyangium]|uniref:Glycosyltransferase family 2 protein n=2 Tax=Polyangium TaxID=55 RepID=A0A4U1JEF5_9BACT|nr:MULTISPECIES: glycosyltransferase family A protein [Polyangium]MDI1434211.1 glycosyltransferase family A protein [Polyangium sorediatum]TKD09180.1 glycosyltransferase family 2 protein [Polyangium fumosum]
MQTTHEPSEERLPTLPDRAGIGDEEKRLGEAFRARYASEFRELVVRREVKDPAVTLVVISYRAADYLLDCLRHLRGQTVALDLPYEILLADSGGLDHLRDRYGNLVDVELRLRDGLPLNVARNAAMGWARGELVAYIDDDGLVVPDWVEYGVNLFRDETIGAARGRIVPHKHPWYNVWAGHYDRGDDLWDEDNVSTEGNMLIRRAVYLAIGGFRDDLYGGEGLYLAYRMKHAFPALRSVYAPGMIMRHDYCRSAREFIWKSRRYKDVRKNITGIEPAFDAYMATFDARKKPVRKRTPTEEVVLAGMRAAQSMIARMPIFDRVKRR